MIADDDILRMARKAGAAEPLSLYARTDYVVMTISELKYFAALVATAQKEFDAKLVDANAMACEKPGPRSMLQANADEIRNGGPIDDWKDEL